MIEREQLPRIEDWTTKREHYVAWWQQAGTVLHVLAPRESARRDESNPQAPFFYLVAGLDTTLTYPTPEAATKAWLAPTQRAADAARFMTGIAYCGDAFPFYDTNLGPGNLATFLGSTPSYAADTVWYHPCIDDADNYGPLVFSPENDWFQRQKAIIEQGVALSQGRYMVSMPDLVEGLDILASLRGTDKLLFDLLDRPAFVTQRLAEINQAYFAAFDAFYSQIAAPWGGNVFSAFAIWGPGKTGKVQCDAAAMISPEMFAQFAVPALQEQCAWLDYSMYHLDGTQAIRHLDLLLGIDELDAIEWTPQVNQPQGGDPAWYDLYRRIRAAGKGVQAINVSPEQVIPLLEAVGPDGMFVMVNVDSEPAAFELVAQVERYLGR